MSAPGDPQWIKAPVRLAFRREGRVVNAYFAKSDTMEGARLLASVGINFLETGTGYFDRWKDLLAEIFTEFISDITDANVLLEEERAPEHEKSGHG